LIPKTKDRATQLMCTILQTIIYNNYQIVNITCTFKKTPRTTQSLHEWWIFAI